MDLKNNRGVHIAHCNVRSLAANFNVIKQQIHDSGIHIFTLSETWLNSNHASNYLRIHRSRLEISGIASQFAIQNARFAIHNKLMHSKIANHLKTRIILKEKNRLCSLEKEF